MVDRKDLDYQTMKEYDRFEKGAANSNTSTVVLKRQLEDPDAHIIITTIQKLATFIKKNPGAEVYIEAYWSSFLMSVTAVSLATCIRPL